MCFLGLVEVALYMVNIVVFHHMPVVCPTTVDDAMEEIIRKGET